MQIGIISTPEGYEKDVIPALKELNISYYVIDIFSEEWYMEFEKKQCIGYILRPPTQNNLWRDIYFKRLLLIKDKLNGITLPNINDVLYYESKIMMSDFFNINKIPHSKSYTFFKFKDAWTYTKQTPLPAVIKSDGGSGGRGVKVIKNRKVLLYHVFKSFFTKHKFKSFHNSKEIILNFKRLFYPFIKFKRNDYTYFPLQDSNRGYFHIQEAVNIKAEWRMVKIGNSYFGHQKVADNRGIHSGTKKKNWSLPPEYLLNFVRDICYEHNLQSMSFDIFETYDNKYLVNEMQVVFGTSTPYQMLNEGVPCRFIYQKDTWILEEGDFCKFGCNILRIQTLLEEIEKNKESNYKNS